MARQGMARFSNRGVVVPSNALQAKVSTAHPLLAMHLKGASTFTGEYPRGMGTLHNVLKGKLRG